MQSTKKIVLLMLCILVSISCNPYVTQNNNYHSNAIVVISPNFQSQKHWTIAVLPFVMDGRDGLDYTTSDKFALHCMEMGFRIVERTQLESIFSELGLEMSGALNKNDMSKIGKLLNLDMLVFGTIKYQWVSGRALIIEEYAGAKGGYYTLVSETIRFVDVQTGEVLISTYCPSDGKHSVSEEISKAIRYKLFSTQYNK